MTAKDMPKYWEEVPKMKLNASQRSSLTEHAKKAGHLPFFWAPTKFESYQRKTSVDHLTVGAEVQKLFSKAARRMREILLKLEKSLILYDKFLSLSLMSANKCKFMVFIVGNS